MRLFQFNNPPSPRQTRWIALAACASRSWLDQWSGPCSPQSRRSNFGLAELHLGFFPAVHFEERESFTSKAYYETTHETAHSQAPHTRDTNLTYPSWQPLDLWYSAPTAATFWKPTPAAKPISHAKSAARKTRVCILEASRYSTTSPREPMN